MSKEKSGFGKFLVGAAIGAGLGVLFAPKSGKETREELKEKLDDLAVKLKDISADDVKITIEAKIEDIKDGIKNLDKETVKKKAKAQAKKVKDKAEDLVSYAKEKTTPVIEAAAEEVKASTVKTLENITAKLKDDDAPKKKTSKKTSKKSSK